MTAELPPPVAPVVASANPILPGYYADPSILQADGRVYIYATLDPWGGATLGCWESADFKNWSYRELNWPTKAACSTAKSKKAGVWAPSVVRAADGKFAMYVSVGSEVWVGLADHPLGPWRNPLGGQPLIPGDYKPGFHMIDAEAFVDDDGQAYLYWGSGLNWKNGRCWVVRLMPDMFTFDGEPRDVTPANYFEAPFMVKHGGRYHLMYSQGKTTADTYQVHYAVGDSPMGPFVEAKNSPILVTDPAKQILSPGHHAVFQKDGKSYILYHRHSIPFDRKFIGRQVCVDPLVFGADGMIEKVVPTHAGPALVQGRAEGRTDLSRIAVASASSQANDFTGPGFVLDDNYATRWAAARDAAGAWLQLDLGAPREIGFQEIRPEYAWKPAHFTIEASDDAREWRPVAAISKKSAAGSPIVIDEPTRARYLRLVFPPDMKGADISLFEWALFTKRPSDFTQPR